MPGGLSIQEWSGRIIGVACVLLAARVFGTAQPGALPLRVLLEQSGVRTVQGLSPELLNLATSGHQVDGDQREFVAAFFEPRRGEAGMHVIRLDRRSRRWTEARLTSDDAAGVGNSVTRIQRRSGRIFIDSHVNPSAGRLLILDAGLKIDRILDGWSLAILPSGSIVFHRSQVHFAPTHSLEIGVYDPGSRTERTVYPSPVPDPVRSAFIERVRAAYARRGEDWFRTNNHHMDPALFDSALLDDISVDARRPSFSFRVRYGNRENAKDPLGFTQDVLVTCSSPDGTTARIACREQPVP